MFWNPIKWTSLPRTTSKDKLNPWEKKNLFLIMLPQPRLRAGRLLPFIAALFPSLAFLLPSLQSLSAPSKQTIQLEEGDVREVKKASRHHGRAFGICSRWATPFGVFNSFSGIETSFTLTLNLSLEIFAETRVNLKPNQFHNALKVNDGYAMPSSQC